MRFDPHKVRQTVLHEMARDGQVFFVHNRVETIGRVAAQLRELLPEATIVVGHGQMSERELARAMRDFVEREADVLVCTTIIESGLDIPNANTIIIHEADMFGLADLHQLRGRVGRYKHRAYAYLLLPVNRPIAPAAEKRLKAIEEFSDLGAGFRIALRDLEIRGAGNILGAEQSGHLAAVGYDLYCRLMERAVRELRNQPAAEPAEVAVALGLEAYVPEAYVGDPAHRIELYRKLHRASSAEDLTTIRDEMRDRFGPLPPPAAALLAEARLRQLARAHGIRAISIEPESLNRRAVSVRYPLVLDAPEVGPLAAALEAHGRRCRVIDDHTVHLDVERSRATGGETRVSPDVLLSFLIETLEEAEQDESQA
jgi:transcription-repair coupling factor (superfamily II helicase)